MSILFNNGSSSKYETVDGQRLNMRGFANYMNVLTGVNTYSANIPTGTNFGDYLYWNGSSYSSGGDNSIVLGSFAGQFNQQTGTISIGNKSGYINSTSLYSISIGMNAGVQSQSSYSVAIGSQAGNTSQGIESVAIGTVSGSINQGTDCVSIGNAAGLNGQSDYAVAIGTEVGVFTQGTFSVGIGNESGYGSLGQDSVAIGYRAFELNGPPNSICISAAIAMFGVTGSNPNSTYINPIRVTNDTGANYILNYNNQTSEITAGTLLSSQAAMTGVPQISDTVIMPIVLQTLNLPAPLNPGTYCLNVEYELTDLNAIEGETYAFYVTDSANSNVSGAGNILTYPVTNIFSTVPTITVSGSGFLSQSGGTGPFPYTSNSTPPSLQIVETIGTSFNLLGSSQNSKFQAWYVPM